MSNYKCILKHYHSMLINLCFSNLIWYWSPSSNRSTWPCIIFYVLFCTPIIFKMKCLPSCLELFSQTMVISMNVQTSTSPLMLPYLFGYEASIYEAKPFTHWPQQFFIQAYPLPDENMRLQPTIKQLFCLFMTYILSQDLSTGPNS